MAGMFKVVSLFVRVLARPIVQRTKTYASSGLKDSWMRGFFIWCGNTGHRIDVLINRSLLRIESSPLKLTNPAEAIALESGIEIFYEFLVYACILGLPIYEIYAASVEADEKSEKQKAAYSAIEDRIAKLEGTHVKTGEQIEGLKARSQELKQKSSTIEQALHQATIDRFLYATQALSHSSIVPQMSI